MEDRGWELGVGRREKFQVSSSLENLKLGIKKQ
jgi:hypothetical protein